MDIKPILYFIIIGGPFLMGSWDLCFFWTGIQVMWLSVFRTQNLF
jgi:hypothetical protein